MPTQKSLQFRLDTNAPLVEVGVSSKYKLAIGLAFLQGTENALLFGGSMKLFAVLGRKSILAVFFLAVFFSSFADAQIGNRRFSRTATEGSRFRSYTTTLNYPTSPDQRLTPGALCTNPDSRRYPERIAYCNRAVDSETKIAVMEAYDSQLGYKVRQMKREEFKIDHYIPLCMGGGNVPSNLWPQHKTVYEVTDPIEPLLCSRMEQGRLTQKQAVEIIQRAKADLNYARQYVQSLY